MNKTHIPEEVQAQFQQCVERAIAIFFSEKVNIKRACEIAVNKITGFFSPDIIAAHTGQEIWFLMESEVADRLRKEVGLGQRDPIVQTVVAESAIGKPTKNKERSV